jgi:hypothetical protein
MEQPPPIEKAPPSPAMPLWARLMNIFAVPGAVFENVRLSRVMLGNWLIPLLLAALVTAVSAFIVVSQPALQQQMRMSHEKQIEAQVKAGMSRADANRIQALGEKVLSPPVLKTLGALGGTVIGSLQVFGWGVILWFIGKSFLKVSLPFGKALEVAGLAGMIAVLGIIVTLLLQVNFSNPSASPNLAAPPNLDTKNSLHLVLAALMFFDLWHLIILAIGLARLSGQPFARASFAVVGFWLVWMTIRLGFSAFSGLG